MFILNVFYIIYQYVAALFFAITCVSIHILCIFFLCVTAFCSYNANPVSVPSDRQRIHLLVI